MSDIDYDETVSLSIMGQRIRRVSLAEAIRRIIAIPQKCGVEHSVRLSEGPPLSDYAQIVSLYARPDFPERTGPRRSGHPTAPERTRRRVRSS